MSRNLAVQGAIALAYVLAMGLVFRTAIFSGFDMGFGERGDAIIEISILEHWRNVLSGVSTWDTTFYFHPYRGTLGYNDGYFLYGLVYAFWRLFADPFQADTLNILTVKSIGFAGAYWLVARTLDWGRATALFVAVIWTVSSNIWLQAVHAQLQSVALLPLAMTLAIDIVRAEQAQRNTRARARAVVLAALMAAWLLTSYYMAWFTIFSACLFVACWSLLTGAWRPRAALTLVRRHAGTLLSGGIAFAVSVVPFLAVYLPKMRETGGEPFYEMLGYLVTPGIDMINVGAGNYMWGWIFRPLLALVHAALPQDPALPGRVLGGEHSAGFPVILFVLIVTALWTAIRRPEPLAPSAFSPELRAFALAMAIAWLLTLQFWVLSPWNLVFGVVPGAKGMRVVSRYQLWLTLPFLLIVAAVWRARASTWARRHPWAAAALITALVAEHLSAETPVRLSRTVHRAALWTIPAPPTACDSFYAVATRVREPLYINAELHALYPHNVDAMLLAELWRVPTINGFSTFNPPDWNFATPRGIDYDRRVRAYARAHALRRLCRLDIRRRQPWSLPRAGGGPPDVTTHPMPAVDR